MDRLGAEPLGAEDDPASVVGRLCTVPGIGPWTAAETVQRTHGAQDTVAVGDYHLAHHVGEALTGRRTDDAGLLRRIEAVEHHVEFGFGLRGRRGATGAWTSPIALV